MINKNFVITEKNAEQYISCIADFIRKSVERAGRSGVVLGMSGGIDSAVVARLCQKAGINVELVMLPDDENTVTNIKNIEDAMEMVNEFGFNYRIIDIKDICNQFENAIDEPLRTLSRMNIPPRVRMSVLYALAQNNSAFVIGTGNLDERLLGYFTKWGDGAHDLNPLGMLTKGEVRVLARHLEVPQSIINKPPSAGLYEGQTDEGELGATYEEIDNFILYGTSGSTEADQIIKNRIAMSTHKLASVPIFDGSDQTMQF
ncbi:MAG: NAD(+) synthase [Christensenellaceae bacterium]|jgi:NAD+ synthase|nr:NAD(+) synthase [Christensenellaceae bacterium]